MRRIPLYAILLATLAFAAPARAGGLEESICVNEVCVPALPVPVTCPPKSLTVTGTWYYSLGSGAIRDPPIPNTYYVATWSSITYYQVQGTGCIEIAYACQINVGDGGVFKLVRVGTIEVTSGVYKGVAATVPTITCGTTSAYVDAYLATLVRVQGFGTDI